VLPGYLSLTVGAAALVGFYMLSIEVYLAAYALGEFHMSFGGFGPTEMRLLIVIGNLWLFFHAGMPAAGMLGKEHSLFDIGGVIATGGMVLMMLAAAARHTRMLYALEPLPPADSRAK
jgi:archaetidylinositol phosphate synthase